MKYAISRFATLFPLNKDFPEFELQTGWDYDLHFDQAAQIYNKNSSSFSYYQYLIDQLIVAKNTLITPLWNLMSGNFGDDRVIGLRHDIDMDPIAGLRCARYLAMRGVGGSFYLLHTNPYYGVWYKNTFVRNPYLKRWVIDFLVSGCELGLHNDCMHVYKNLGFDGTQALNSEIAWLRAVGVNVLGTVAHASGPMYGAENYEIFMGRRLWDRSVASPSGRKIPLNSLSEDSLGIKYEGTFTNKKKEIDTKMAEKFFFDKESSSVRSETWMRLFLQDNPTVDYATDCQFWFLGNDQWVIAGKLGTQNVFEWMVDLDRVFKFIHEMPPRSRSIIVIHPEYVRL